MYPYIIQGDNVTVVIGSEPHTINKSSLNYNAVIQAIKDGDWDTVKNIIDPVKQVLEFGQGNVAVKGTTLYWKDRELKGALANQVIRMIQEGFSVEPMVAFMERLMSNPSKRATEELYGFLENGNLPITEDGCFLAYKKVRDNYRDVHSGTVLNAPAYMLDRLGEPVELPVTSDNGATTDLVDGEVVVSMERNMVNDDKDQTCSEGLHFCSRSYLGSFGGDRVLILKIDPADVVSIPSDYNHAKGRTCKYTVVGEIGVDKDNLEDIVVDTVGTEDAEE